MSSDTPQASETPRTDALWRSFGQIVMPMDSPLSLMLLHAREIERELEDAKFNVRKVIGQRNRWDEACQQVKAELSAAEQRCATLTEENARLAQELADVKLEIAQQYVLMPVKSWNWLMGLGESFEPPADTPIILNRVPAFWWRTELRRRMAADDAAIRALPPQGGQHG